MRLPTLTRGQAALENARVFHETLWTLAQAGERMRMPATAETLATRAVYRQHGSLHAFWNRRGYSVKTRVADDRTALEIWLVPKSQKVAA